MDLGRRTSRSTAPALLSVTLAASAALAGLVVALPAVTLPLLGLAAVVIAAAVAVVVLQLRLSTLLAASICLQIFSGNWQYLGLPIGLDRLLLVAALAALLRDARSGALQDRIRLRPVHTALAAMSCIAVLSAIFADTLFTTGGAFALLDRLGFVPFLAFTLAPLAFRTRDDRNRLLVAVTVIGGYLGVTALLEGVGLGSLALPAYIDNEALGIHYGRARGPFLEAVANGLGLYVCAVGAAVAVATWRRSWARWLAGTVVTLCMLGTVFTLTRAVWLSAVVATLVAAMTVPRLRRLIAPAAVVGTAAVLLALAFVPGLSERVTERSNDERSLWDRYNTNLAAVRIVEDRPLTGVGWQRFPDLGPGYMRQSEQYPLTGVGIEVHNVPLSHAAELGLPAAVLFVVCLALAVGHALLRPAPPDLVPWRAGLWAIAAAWGITAAFGPLSYAFPNTVLWLWAGIVLGPYLRRGPAGARRPGVGASGPPPGPAVPAPSAPPSARQRSQVSTVTSFTRSSS